MNKYIATKDSRTLVVTKYGLHACGENDQGQLGLGDKVNRSQLEPMKINDQNIAAKDVKAIAAGSHHTLVLTTKGLWACGNNSYGQLGLGDTKKQLTLQPMKINDQNIAAKDVKAIAAGSDHSLVLTTKGLYGCGSNGFGQLGLGDKVNRYQLEPMKINGQNIAAKDVKAIAAGSSHSLVLTTKGLYACGHNEDGQLGLGDKVFRYQLKPMEIKGQYIAGNNIKGIAAGINNSFVWTKKVLYACGLNDMGQLGFGDKMLRLKLEAVKIPDLNIPDEIKAVTTGRDYSLVRTQKGLYDCGDMNLYQVKPVFKGHSRLELAKIRGQKISGEDIVETAVGRSLSFVLTKKQGLWAYGENSSGQFGLGYEANKIYTQYKSVLGAKEFAGLFEIPETFNEKMLKNQKYLDLTIKTE